MLLDNSTGRLGRNHLGHETLEQGDDNSQLASLHFQCCGMHAKQDAVPCCSPDKNIL